MGSITSDREHGQKSGDRQPHSSRSTQFVCVDKIRKLEKWKTQKKENIILFYVTVTIVCVFVSVSIHPSLSLCLCVDVDDDYGQVIELDSRCHKIQLRAYRFQYSRRSTQIVKTTWVQNNWFKLGNCHSRETITKLENELDATHFQRWYWWLNG